MCRQLQHNYFNFLRVKEAQQDKRYTHRTKIDARCEAMNLVRDQDFMQSGQWVDIIDRNIDHLQNLPQITVLTKLLDFFIQLN